MVMGKEGWWDVGLKDACLKPQLVIVLSIAEL